MKSISAFALFTTFSAAAIAQNGANPGSLGASCLKVDDAAMTRTANGHLAEAETLLGAATLEGDSRAQAGCTGLVLNHMANILFTLGHLADAERLAKQSVQVLERFYPPDDWVMLRPLQSLTNVLLESGKTARARETVARIQAIQVTRPQDRGIIHVTAAVLLQTEGRRAEAEAEYDAAYQAWQEAGRGDSADVASILDCLGSLYLADGRLEDARRMLERSWAIFNRAKDTVPLDRVKFLCLRGVVDARLGDWRQSEQDLSDALSIADRQVSLEPALIRLVLVNYSYVLRRNHHRREARAIAARLNTIPADRTRTLMVDLSDLLIEKQAYK